MYVHNYLTLADISAVQRDAGVMVVLFMLTGIGLRTTSGFSKRIFLKVRKVFITAPV